MEISNKVALPTEVVERIEYVVLFKDYSAFKAAQYINHLFPNQYSSLEVMAYADNIKRK
jgi:hypothetical protein